MSNNITINKKRELYYKNIERLLETDLPKVAYHFNCTDGLISAVLAKYAYQSEKLIFLPLDYELINDSPLKVKIENADWKIILDLSPFNSKTAELYIDHHISNTGQKMNALKIFYIAGAPSTSYIFYKHYLPDLPEKLIELAKMTEITDSASYRTPAPTSFNPDLSQYSVDDKIWFLEDACKTAFTIEEHNGLINVLFSEGWDGLWTDDIIARVKALRNERKISHDIVSSIEPKDFVIIIDLADHFNLPYIAHELMKKGAKGSAYLTQFPDYVKISLRLSKRLSEQEIEHYRVDTLAKIFGGGGHKPAAGAQSIDLDETVNKIENWAHDHGFSVNILDLRERKKS